MADSITLKFLTDLLENEKERQLVTGILNDLSDQKILESFIKNKKKEKKQRFNNDNL